MYESESSRENMTPSSGTSPLVSYKGESSLPGNNFKGWIQLNKIKSSGIFIGWCQLFVNSVQVFSGGCESSCTIQVFILYSLVIKTM